MKSLESRCAPWYARCPNTYRHSYTHITHAHHTFTGDYPAYTVRLDVDDAAFLSELKRTHKTKIDGRTWAKGRAALAELAQNGRARDQGPFRAGIVCAKPNVYSARASTYWAFTSLLDQDAQEAAASRGTFRGCDFSPEYLYAVASAFDRLRNVTLAPQDAASHGNHHQGRYPRGCFSRYHDA